MVRGKIILFLLTNKLLEMQLTNFYQTKATRCLRDVFRIDADSIRKQNSDRWVLLGLFVRPLFILY